MIGADQALPGAHMTSPSDPQSIVSATLRPRQRLDSLDRVRREAVRLYREGRDGTRPAGDVHHLTASLAIIGGMLEGQGR